MRQPGLFNFKPTEQLRKSGLTPEEERGVIAFCLSDNYPRSYVVERTGTAYTLPNRESAALLLRALDYESRAIRQLLTGSDRKVA